MFLSNKDVLEQKHRPEGVYKETPQSPIGIANPYLVTFGMHLSANIGRLRTPVSDLVMPVECQEEIQNLRQQRAALEAEITELRESNKKLLNELFNIQNHNYSFSEDTDDED